MHRRDISKALFATATAAGAVAVTRSADAQTCTPPCYAPTAAESAVAAQLNIPITTLVSNTAYPPGHVYRYGTNTSPGGTPMDTALNQAAAVCRQGNYTLQLAPDLCLVTAPLDFSGIRVAGTTSSASLLKASSAQFNVITSTGNTTLENFSLNGGWDGSSSGQSGYGLYFYNGTTGFAYNIHIYNVGVSYTKSSGVYWQGAGYSHCSHLDVIACGLHGIEIYGTSLSAMSTTVHISGQSRFSSTPYGYAVKLTECALVVFDGCIMEDTKGIQLNGNDNRALTFNNVYQENTAGNIFLDGSNSAGIGLRVTGCYDPAASIANISGWTSVYFGGNVLSQGPVPFTNRIFQADGGEVTTSITGGVSVTAAAITLNPGTYLIFATVQTIQSTASGLVESACELTTNPAASGLNNSTNAANFTVGAAQQNFSPNGTAMDQRLNCFTLMQLTAATAVYLRAYLNFSGAGALAYHGFINAVLFE